MDENPYLSPKQTALDPHSLPPRSSWRSTVFTLLGILGIVGIGAALLLPARRSASSAAHSTQCVNNLRQIGVALHNYHAVYGAFPPAYTTDAAGKPLHSWRALILPFVEGRTVTFTIDLSKPWDDPANAAAFNERIPSYECPSGIDPPGHTRYLAVVTHESCLRANQPRRLGEITDGESATLQVIEVDAAHAVHWMAPVEADEQLVLGLSSDSTLAHRQGVNALFADGSVQFLDADTSAAQRRAMISIAGGDDEVLGDLD